MLVHKFLEDSARHFVEKVALICDDQRLTYHEIDQRCNRVANFLVEAGIRKGDRVAVYFDNRVEAVIAIFAILKAGGAFVVLNRTTKYKKLCYVLNNCQAVAIFTDAQAAGEFAQLSSDVPSLKCVVCCGAYVKGLSARFFSFEEILQDYPADKPAVSCIDVDLAALIYTSGSTGSPKGVISTHLNIVSAATSITQYLSNENTDIILNVLPLSFDYGLYQLLMAFKFGGTLVLEKSFLYPMVIIKKLIEESVTGFPIVPTMSALLLRMHELKSYEFKSLRYITNTGAHLPISHIKKLRQIFPHTKIYCMYGLTECKRVSYLEPDQIDAHPGSVGRGMPNEEVYLVDENNQRIENGAIGELVVRGSNVMKGYWGLPLETAEVFRPGRSPWETVLYTGDLFRQDEDGYLFFVGRKDEIIKCRGEKVSPKEVENVIYNMDNVVEVVVVGIEDRLLGEAIKAYVVCKDYARVTERDVKKQCLKYLEDYMIPRFVEFRKELPKNPSGKIDKKRLMAGAEFGTERESIAGA